MSIHDNINAFEAEFRAMEMDYPLAAATYYVLYISPLSNYNRDYYQQREFSSIFKEAKKVRPEIKRKHLEYGRKQLFEKGIIAKILWDFRPEEFGSEAFIPADPTLVWEWGSEKLKGQINSEIYSGWTKSIKPLYDAYEEYVGNCGVGIDNGKLVLSYRGMWINHLTYCLCKRKQRNISLWVSGKESCKDPMLEYYHRVLKKNAVYRIILNRSIDINPIVRLKKQYPNNVDIRFISFVTTRRMTIIDDVMAIDGVRILPESMTLPIYIGVVYVNNDDQCGIDRVNQKGIKVENQRSNIEHLQANFDGRWKVSKKLK